MSDRHVVTVDESASGERLDRALAAALPDLTRSRVKALIESRRVALEDGRTIEEPSRKVKTGERFIVDIPEPEPAEPRPQAIDLDILYEDSDLLVVNKPAGLVVHPAPGNPDSTLVNALLAHCGDSLSGIGGVRRPGIVHRLDKDTSGVMVVAKNDRSHQGLAKLFAAHNLTRASVLASRLEVAGSLWAKFMGLMGRPSLADETGLWLPDSNGIHMMFMKFSIDAVFLGQPTAADPLVRSVVSIHRGLRAWTGLVPFVRGAHGVLELPVGTIEASRTEVGDMVRLA